MRVEIVAVGTELLLGEIADTNSAWLGEHLSAIGVASHFHQAVGDNHDRIVLALRTALARADGVIVCGGLGPTQDDITREAIAAVMNVELVRDDAIIEKIRTMFASRQREMPENNHRQADVPAGATIIEQALGTAPGLICPVGNKVIYAVPGVPYEMSEMFDRAIGPDLIRRQSAAGETAVIASRVLRTWGTSESALAEALAERIVELDGDGDEDGDRVTLAFLASGIEGLKVRITARAGDEGRALAALDAEEKLVRAVLGARFGDIVFGLDDTTMERALAEILTARGLTLAVAESLTGGLVSSRLVDVEGASGWYRGAVVSYASEVKFDVLGVEAGPVVSESAAAQMASGVRRVLKSDIGLALTGVAGPTSQDGQDPGTVIIGFAIGEEDPVTVVAHLPGDRSRIRQYAAISALDGLRRMLLAR